MLLAIICISCDDQNVDSLKMGEDYVDGESGIILIDTLSVELSTVLIDSISTSNSKIALVGRYEDLDFGEIKSEAIFRVNLPSSSFFDDDDIFDSITICLSHNSYYIGDTSASFSLKVKELNTDLEEIDQSAFYNTTHVSSKAESLGEFEYYPRPNKSEELEFRLRDDFGSELFDLFMNDENEIKNNTLFLDYFKGIVLAGGDENKSIFGYTAIDTSLCMKMYYHRIESDIVELEAVFKLESSNYQFNSIETERGSTKLNSLKVQDENISSTLTDDKCYIQGGTGLMTKVKFPGLSNIFQMVLLDQIVKVELVFEPTTTSWDIHEVLPSSLLVYETNKVNTVNNLLVSNNSTLPMTLLSNLYDYENNGYYSIDITNYIVTELLDGYFDPEFSFLIGLTSDKQSSSFTSLILGGENNDNYTPKLKIYTYYY